MTTTPGVANAAIDEAVAAATTDLHLDTARALVRLPASFGDRLLPAHPDYDLICELTRDLVRAGLPLHDCDAHERTGGVCLTPSSEPAGVVVAWATHTTMALDVEASDQHADARLLMRFAVDDVLSALGWQSERLGGAGSHVVTGRLARARASDTCRAHVPDVRPATTRTSGSS